MLTDSLFIAARKAGYNSLADGGICGIVKVASVVVGSGTGAYGLYCACASGSAAAVLASLVLMATVLHYRPSPRKPFRTLRPLLRYSGANYAGNVLSLLPSLVAPLIVLDRLGAPAEAYFYVAMQVATILYSASYAVGQTFLAEGSHADADWRKLLWRSGRFLMALCVPACLALAVAARWVLLMFGAKYSQHGTPTLILLALTGIPVALNSWLMTMLRLMGRLKTIVLSNVVCAVTICGLTWVLAPRGTGALAAAWLIGELLSVAVAASAVFPLPPSAPPRHRRATRTRRLPPGSLRRTKLFRAGSHRSKHDSRGDNV